MTKRKSLAFVLIIGSIAILCETIGKSNGLYSSAQEQKSDTTKIIFTTPAVTCGDISWQAPVITNWLANNCMDKCDDPVTSGYKLSGQIKNSNKNWSIKVVIKTDKEYAQPVRYNPANGTFEGKVYFDRTNRMDTPLKIILRDSNRTTINTFIITLKE
jgi:hypothetical protein